MTLRIALGVVLVMSSACAAGGAKSTVDVVPQRASAARQDCQATDSSFVLGSLVYTECGVDRPARELGRQPRMDFGPRPPFKECYNAVVAVVIDERGSTVPASARIVRTNDTEFAQAFLNTIPGWRFTPAQKDGLPVKQVVQIGQGLMVRVTSGSRPMGPPSPTRSPRC
jgi:hypothetical protein